MNAPDFDLDDLMTVKAAARRYPDLFESESRLRYLLRHREANGLSHAVVQRGGQLRIIRPRLLEWWAEGARS